jgi:hypothetical protein
MVCDGTWHDIPGGGSTPSQPIGIYVGALNTQFANSISVVVRGMDNLVYHHHCRFTGATCAWDPGWATVPGGKLTNTAPYSYVGAAWDILVLDQSSIPWHVINWGTGWTAWGMDVNMPWGTPTSTTDAQGRTWQFQRSASNAIQYRCGLTLCNGCSISGTCYADAANNPANDCQYCNVALSATAWTSKSAKATCASGLCTGPLGGDVCCQGCVVGSTCYANLANNPANECQYCNKAMSNSSWTSKPATTACTGGVCAGALGGDVCCQGCVVGSTCYANLANNPANECQYCNTTVSRTSWTSKPVTATCTSGVCSGPLGGDICCSGCYIDGACRLNGAVKGASGADACLACTVATSRVAWSSTAVAETIAGGNCADQIDNDCDSERDYDGRQGATDPSPLPWPHGDAGCPVGVTAISAPALLCLDETTPKNVPLNCTFSVRGVFGNATITDSAGHMNYCTWLGWDGATTKGMYDCTMQDLVTGTATVSCGINAAVSYNNTPAMTATVALSGLNQPCVGGICNAAKVCADTVQWDGVVRDELTGLPVWGGVTITVDGVANHFPSSNFNLPIKIGTRTIEVNASGYNRRTIILTVTVPFTQDVALGEPECQSDCTRGGYCDYTCVGVNGCVLPPDPSGALLREYCGVGLVAKGAIRDMRPTNATHVAVCCLDFKPVTEYKAPLTIESCSENIAQQRTVVNVNGKFLELTVATYRQCEK